jgi:ABC-type lipoprotein export system ATPase subunit
LKRKPIQNLRLENLTFAYEGMAPIFEDITFDLPTGRAVWVRSPGGRGKSTLLRLLSGLLAPQQGRYLINGESVTDMSFEQFLNYRMSMGYGFDMGGLLNNKTLLENLTLPLLYHNLLPYGEAVERVTEIMSHFGILSSKDQRPFAVSGSQRKLTCVLRAFVHNPQVIFLDDPLTGLKQDNLNDLFHFMNEGYASRGLRQVFFTGESTHLAEHFKAEELLISGDWFTSRSVA